MEVAPVPPPARLRRVRILLLILVLVCPVLASALNRPLLAGDDAGASPSPAAIPFTILHTNDMHGQVIPELDPAISRTEPVGGIAWLAGYVARERRNRADRILLLDAGDFGQGPALSSMTHGYMMADCMNLMRYDAATLGNHEFDWTPRGLDELVHRVRHPIVCANLQRRDTHRPPERVRPYVILHVGGIPIGITGLIAPETARLAPPADVASFEFLPPAAALRQVMSQMRAQGVRAVIVISHLGEKDDRALASEVDGVAVIVGGHSHSALVEPVIVNDTVIVQTGKSTHYLGRLDLSLDPRSGRVLTHTSKTELIPVVASQVSPDAAVATVVQKYSETTEPELRAVVGSAASACSPDAAPGFADTPLGNLLADAIREEGRSQVAITTTGGVRRGLSAGPIRMEDMYAIVPYVDDVVTMSVTGRQLRSLLDPKATRFQVSGLTFAVDANGRAHDIKVGGAPLKAAKRYTLTMVGYIARGNLGSHAWMESAHPRSLPFNRNIVQRYLGRHRPLHPTPSSRIRVPVSPRS